ncbi:MAG: cellulase family glycosylhydrolase [Kiritimatiellaeota bacterium]|nr:cellulase family glycosylhydrolase [Kiritimatiellota bacterium]
MVRRILCCVWLLACVALAAELPRVVIAPDGRGFVLADSKQPFHPLGFNYGNHGRLIEDFWTNDWAAVARDFRKMKKLGANMARVHLQFDKFMCSDSLPRPEAMAQLGKLVALANETSVYLDLTGLASYRPADVPAWYDALDDAGRWATQAAFWEAIAKQCATNPAVFCFDLMNEPISPAGPRKPGQWRSGNLLGGYDFVQFIALAPAGRKREDIAKQWIRAMTAAIRKHDTKTLITVGQLPWVPKWGHLSGFIPEAVTPELDFVSVHIYPEKGKVPEALAGLKKFCVGKPVVIEETFNLACGPEEELQFLRDSRMLACGWLGHYDGITASDYDALKAAGKLTIPQSIWRAWLDVFCDFSKDVGNHEQRKTKAGVAVKELRG